MRSVYLVSVGVALVALLVLAALTVGWAWLQRAGVMGPGMMYGGPGYSSSANRLTIDEAAAAAAEYLEGYRQDLAVVEVMEFSRNFYAEVEEEDTGIHAMELLVDKSSGRVYPEPGPNMMWNTKYGHMRGTMGMMGDYYRGGSPATDMPVMPEEAQELAQRYLDANSPGLTVGHADIFYGYYTLHTLKSDQVEGMLSVNEMSGTTVGMGPSSELKSTSNCDPRSPVTSKRFPERSQGGAVSTSPNCH